MFQRILSGFLIGMMFLSPLQPLLAYGPSFEELYPKLKPTFTPNQETDELLNLPPFDAPEAAVVPYRIIDSEGPIRAVLVIDVDHKAHRSASDHVISRVVRLVAPTKTQDMNFEQINALLRDAGSHIDPAHFTHHSQNQIYFAVTIQKETYLREAIHYLSQIASASLLENEDLEFAISQLPGDYDLARFKQFYATYYLNNHQNMRVVFVGKPDAKVVEEAMKDYFDFVPTNALSKASEGAPLNEQLLDGKIELEQPGLLGTRSSKRWFFPGISTLLSGCGYFVGRYLGNPAEGAGIGLALGALIGGVVVSKDSPNDPIVAQENREQLLALSYTQASAKPRFDELITPQEKRKMFMKQFIDGRNLDALATLDTSSKSLKQILASEERALIDRATSDYRKAKELAETQLTILNSEYTLALRPLKIAQECSLREADRTYQSNPSVMTLERLDRNHKIEMKSINQKEDRAKKKANSQAEKDRKPMKEAIDYARKIYHQRLTELRRQVGMTPPPFNPATLPDQEQRAKLDFEETIKPHEDGLKWVANERSEALKEAERVARKARKKCTSRYEYERAFHLAPVKQAEIAKESAKDWANTAYTQGEARIRQELCYNVRTRKIKHDLSLSKDKGKGIVQSLAAIFEAKTNRFEDTVRLSK